MAQVSFSDDATLLYPVNQTFSLHSVLINLSSGHGLDKQQWNALIGIVTAIVGNVLISFALNLQRYAHIRLNKEEKIHHRHTKSSPRDEERYSKQKSAADGRSALNAKASSDQTNGKIPDETTSLINGKQRRTSSDSENTVRPAQLEIGNEDDENDDEQTKTSYLKSPWWWAGIILMTIGEAGNFLAYGFAPASLVSPLGVVALISNCIIAPWLLKEKFRKRDALGVLIAIGGVVTLVLSSEGQEKRMGPDEIWHEITRWEFELYLGLTVGAIIALVWASEKYGDRTLLIDLGLVGLFGGYTALSTKGVASMLSDTLWKAVTFPITYLLVAILIGTAVMQVRYLNRALSRFDSTQVIPTQFVMFTISVIVGSAVLYRDFESADAERFAKFIGGCALTFSGVYMITSGRQNEDDDDDEHEDEHDVEQGINLLDGDQNQENVDTGTYTTPTHSRRTSLRPGSRVGVLERMVSNASQRSQPFTPTSIGPDSPFDENPWMDSPRQEMFHHPNHTTASILTDAAEGGQARSTNNTPVRPSLLSSASGRHARNRRSIADIFGGPISTPLSSSLSGVIADRRRELEASSAKLRRLGLRKTRSSRLRSAEAVNDNNEVQVNTPSTPSFVIDSVPTDDTEELPDQDTPSKQFRSRSLSLGGSIGGFLKSGMRKKSTGNDQGDTKP